MQMNLGPLLTTFSQTMPQWLKIGAIDKRCTCSGWRSGSSTALSQVRLPPGGETHLTVDVVAAGVK